MVTRVPTDLLSWADRQLHAGGAAGEIALVPLAGDASARRYFRLLTPGASYIVAEAPPATEKNKEFLEVQAMLVHAGIRVPGIVAADLEKGFMLLEDLGDRLLLPELDERNVQAHYDRARDLLLRMATVDASQGSLPAYDEAILTEELGRFPQWFVEALLGHALSPSDQDCLDALCRLLLDSAAEQPRVLVHRDFHSRNLMLLEGEQLAVIDFQDAVIGPVTYDLVSLLKDCYVRWPAHRVRAWALSHRDALRCAGLIQPVSDESFLRWFDLMGLQRHIKVLGTFARLYLRDGKSAYLRDLPLVIDYVREASRAYAPREAAFADFTAWFDSTLGPLIAGQPWSATA